VRKAGNWGLTQLVNVLFSQNFTDLCYGFHAFWRHCLDSLDLESMDGFEIDASIYLQAVRNKLKVVEVPSFEGFRFYGIGKLQTFPDGWRVLRTILREWNASFHQPTSMPEPGFRSYSLGLPSWERPTIPLAAALEEQARAERGKRKRYHLEELLGTYLQTLPREEIERLLSAILVEVVERLGASSGSLVMLDNDLHENNGYQVFGRTIKPVPVQTMHDILQDGIAGQAIRDRQPMLISRTASDPRWLNRDWEQQEQFSRSAVAVPFMRGDKVIAVLVVTRPEDRVFTEYEVNRIRFTEIFL